MAGSVSHGTTCPRCYRAVGITKKDKLYSHNNPYGAHCPYSGVTIDDAVNRINSLARKLLDTGHVKNKETGKWEKVS